MKEKKNTHIELFYHYKNISIIVRVVDTIYYDRGGRYLQRLIEK